LIHVEPTRFDCAPSSPVTFNNAITEVLKVNVAAAASRAQVLGIAATNAGHN
jgi:hypothetical protein